MILVDTSVWIGHFKKTDQGLVDLLNQDRVVIHPFIIGEIACGVLNPRDEILYYLQQLPLVTEIDLEEFLFFTQQHHLFKRSVGFVDIHLLAACFLNSIELWSKDKKLQKVAISLNCGYLPPTG